MDADAAESWVRSWSASVSERAAQAQEMSRLVAELSASATSADGAVRVTVAASGVVTDLRLSERVQGWSAARIAEEVMTTMRRAQAQLSEAVADVAARTVGEGSETGRAVVASYTERFPELSEADDDRSRRRQDGW
ncbi:YbaB/EbfC family nucleoid-associated protein [Micromonospora zamorensis]|uniref:YbaB/EbfC family nucleoid-associated protein n=1 Tax=Micromonospora zamorensis TaxID=709883 RepID=UPI0033EF5694